MILAPEFRESDRGTRGELRTTTTFHGCHIFLQDRWSTIYVRVTKNARKSRIILERRSDSAPRSGQLAKLVCPEVKNGSSLHPPLLGTWKSRHTTRRSGKGQEQPRMKFLEILNESRYRGCISKFTPLSLRRLFQIWRTPACSNKRESRRIPNCCSTWLDNRSWSALGTYKTPIPKLKPVIPLFFFFLLNKIWQILETKTVKFFFIFDRSRISYLGACIFIAF